MNDIVRVTAEPSALKTGRLFIAAASVKKDT
jgi:hypothetical protein